MSAPAAPYDGSSLDLSPDARGTLAGALYVWNTLSEAQREALRVAVCARCQGEVTAARLRTTRTPTAFALRSQGLVVCLEGPRAVWLLTPLGLLVRQVGMGAHA